MLRAEVTDAGIYVADGAGSTMRVGAPDWQTTGNDSSAPDQGETVVAGLASHLDLPPVYASVDPGDSALVAPGGSATAPNTNRRFRSVKLPPGEHRVRLDGPVGVNVRFDGAAVLTDPGTEAAALIFPAPTEVTIELDRAAIRPGTITVPRTPGGVARALSALAAGHRTDTPHRSCPDMRGRPPRIAFGDRVDVPEGVAERRPPSRVSLRLPADLCYLFPAASLSYYLGAEVSVEPETTPAVRLPGRSVRLPDQPRFERAVAEHLRRTFLLDCLVRTAVASEPAPVEARHLDALGLDADALFGAPIARRFETYLDAPFERVSEDLPEWHLSMYVDPDYDHVPTLSHLVADVPNLFLPRSEPLESRERLTRALDEFYRSPAGGGYEAASVDPVNPVLGPGRAHGWLADGVPVGVFKTVPEVYERVPRGDDEPLSVVTVLNDGGMSREYADAARIYQDHAEHDLVVTVEKRLTVDELGSVFEAEHDLVHYIGHCDAAGLRCRDGHLSATSLLESNAEAFILNACGSFYEGLELVRKGSAAGAVTFEKVLDGHAAQVGTAFARLLVHGFSIGRALELARRRVIMGTDYAVVGDGTHVLAGDGRDVPIAGRLERADGGAYTLTYEARSPRVTGECYRPPTPDGRPRLLGSAGETTIPAADVGTFLRRVNFPVIFDGDIHWSDELADRLA